MKYNTNFKGHDFKIYDNIKGEYCCENCKAWMICGDNVYCFALHEHHYYSHWYDYNNLKNEPSCVEVIIKNIIE